MKTLLLTRFTLKELIRKRLLVWATAVSALALGLFTVAMLSFYTMGDAVYAAERAPYAAQMEMMALYMVTFVATLLAILTSTGTIAGDVDSGTLLAVLPKPISRWEVLAGKTLAYAILISVYTALMALCLMAISFVTTGIFSPVPLQGILLMILSVLTLLVIAILGSTLSSTMAAAIVVLMLYGFGWAGGLIEIVGRLLKNDTLVNVGTISNLLIPGNKIWQFACYYLQPDVMSTGGIQVNPFFGAVQPSFWMILYALAYIGGVGALAAIVFTRKDL
jgi:Cu-processing system permease protein